MAFFVWDANSFFNYVDMAFLLASPFVNLYWWRKYDKSVTGVFSPAEIMLYSLYIGYMTARSWSTARGTITRRARKRW